jgi:hypothetical protein
VRWLADPTPWLGLLAAAMTAWVGWLTVRQAQQASAKRQQLDERMGTAKEWRELYTEIRKDMRDDRSRIDALESKLDAVQAESRALRQRFDDLGRKYRAALIYIRALLAIMRRDCPSTSPPPPPADLVIDLDGGT